MRRILLTTDLCSRKQVAGAVQPSLGRFAGVLAHGQGPHPPIARKLKLDAGELAGDGGNLVDGFLGRVFEFEGDFHLADG